MEHELECGAKFKQTFGGEFQDPEAGKFDYYGFEIGDLTVNNLTGEEFAKFVCHAIDHLRLNGHVFIRAKRADGSITTRSTN